MGCAPLLQLLGHARLERARPEMRERERQRVCGVRRRKLGQRKNCAHHHRHLTLVGLTVARNRAFDARRCVLENLHARAREREQHDASGVPQLGCSLRVLREEESFHRATVRSVARDDRGQLLVDLTQARRQRRLAVQSQDAVRHVLQAIALPRHDTPTEVQRAGIDAEHNHAPSLSQLL